MSVSAGLVRTVAVIMDHDSERMWGLVKDNEERKKDGQESFKTGGRVGLQE